ncbi:TetR/AcrR family transcriptional regulator [Nocardia jinanensis]|uniref:Transcriptional regulator n=1 Tax=Nocardia jinanensis TaxID=382504 RepID=A0A917RIE7_9NOCA|nr:TetR/AcrR family transcriptional regulator [Nocardia jinanensis]GGL09929.1 transcriptional regulator [Nocardia jinanensis]
MATIATPQDYFDAALELLSSEGYGAVKLAPVCKRLGVTTGSFYHYFENWRDFVDQFLGNWLSARTTQLAESARRRANPIDQLEALLQFTLALPHRAEAEIRAWSKVDPRVKEVQDAVDLQRKQVVLEAARMVSEDEEALRYAQWGIYLLVGYQQVDAGRDIAALEWTLRRLLDELVERARRRTPSGVVDTAG